ncbi:hypothetical protein [Sediminicola sp. 1XM1-17]|uniref:hypothetical protein n=1 Tax=Sediminicola sp. 1XM1-17 TaxID=3127702 RepID=UPI0030787E3B
MLKKVLKIIFVSLSALTVLAIVLFIIYDEPHPESKKNSGTAADAMARQIQTALNQEAFEKSRYLEWSFQNGNNTYLWDRYRQIVRIQWDDITVNLDLKNSEHSEVIENNQIITGSKKIKIVNTASKYYNNDSFWLVAPFKLFDKGTEKSLVELKDGSHGLLVTYTSGGDTPGDSYLWKIKPNGFPESFKMWVSIIPIGGLEATWEGWQKMESSTYLPTLHKIGPITLSMGEVRAYN